MSSLVSSSIHTLGATAAAVLLVCGACSSTESAAKPDPTGACSALASACHPYDKTSTLGHECHGLGHDGTDTACAERKDECLAACPPVADDDAGTVRDASATDAADAAADAVCTAYCDCLGTTCGALTNYPYPDAAACSKACSSLSAEEKECFPKWCAKAEAASAPLHFCEHAWGKLGTVECDTL